MIHTWFCSAVRKSVSLKPRSQVFDSHMVLQRRQPIIISGTAEPSKAVQVEFAGQKVIAVAVKNHEWFAEFSAMKVGGPYKLEITSKLSTDKVKKFIIINATNITK